MEDKEKSTERAESPRETQKKTVTNLKGKDRNKSTEQSNLNSTERKPQRTPIDLQRQKQTFAFPTCKALNRVITNVIVIVLLWTTIWSVIGSETGLGGNLFGLMFFLACASVVDFLFSLVKLPTLLSLPPLFGIVLGGFLIRNIPGFSDSVRFDYRWSSSLRCIALSSSLIYAVFGVNLEALKKLKGVGVRLSMGPCLVEACASAVLAHLLMDLPWQWAFVLGFVLGAVCPMVAQGSVYRLQKEGYVVDKGILTLLKAAASFEDIVAIIGFNVCLSIAFPTDSTVVNVLGVVSQVVIGMATGCLLGFFIQYFPSSNQDNLVWKRACLVLGSSVLVIFSSLYFAFPGPGDLLCTFVMAFAAGIGWTKKKAEVRKILLAIQRFTLFLLFGFFGAEVSIASLRPETAGLCAATLGLAILIRILTTFLMVCFAGFNIKEKLFISFVGLPKAAVQATIGSVALDVARSHGDSQLEEYGMAVLTMAFLATLITVPVGRLLIGLLARWLLQKANSQSENEEVQRESS